ncbi:MAG: SH3 domain-containing protein [Lachnospiraceae bacterium]|nr:SH3 domain-containing protein [Lachnospiraceae bacterium]
MKKKFYTGGLAGCMLFVALNPCVAYAGLVTPETSTVVEVVDNREYVDLVIAQVDRYVNVRSKPDTSGEILGKLYNNSVGHFIEEENGWYKIQSGTVTGYVSAEYCVRGLEALRIARDVEITYATITAGTLRVREKPNTESTILGTFSRGDELEVLAEEDGFAKVSYNNKTGYISLDYVDIHTEFVEAESIEEERARLKAEEEARRKAKEAAEAKLRAQREKEEAAAAAAAAGAITGSSYDLGQQVVDFALQFVGNPYVYGGTSLTDGADCSGFVQSVYAHFGVALPRTGQRSSGYAIASLDEALPGDLIFYSGHVAIYMGDNKIVHAATPKKGICTGNASYTKILAIRRIF